MDPELVAFVARRRDELERFLMEYQFAVDELLTKVTILRREFMYLQHYNPIEHVTSRVKSPASIMQKALRKGVPADLESLREQITDIAGIRITCSFIADTYRVLETLTAQSDVEVLEIKDYIARPKPNGYKSLHAIVRIPVFLSTGPVDVKVEVQIRTVAMDFWASLEHKIFYKFDGDVPARLIDDLAEAARVADELDRRMEELHTEVHGADGPAEETVRPDFDEQLLRHFWTEATEPGTAG